MDDFDSQLIGADSDSLQFRDSVPVIATSQDVVAADNGMDDDEEYQIVPPAVVLKAMHEIWLNESAAPKLLTYRSEHVNSLIDQLENMQENIAQRSEAERRSMKCTIHALEVQRITYVINDYLRTRMRKIEKDPVQAMLEDDNRAKKDEERLLSPAEREFAEKYYDASVGLLKAEFHDPLPGVFHKVPVPKAEYGETRVFFEVLEDGVDNMVVPHMQDPLSEVVVALNKGSRHFAPFASVEEFLERGLIRLL
uniref:DNA replication complex GINS protein SLD5 n=1 Tax=Panagrellus redivivus TaxID=6233 RepID=A0A7E4VU95_PANRE